MNAEAKHTPHLAQEANSSYQVHNRLRSSQEIESNIKSGEDQKEMMIQNGTLEKRASEELFAGSFP